MTLHAGDLIVAGGAGLYRVDRTSNVTRIVSGDYVVNVRGVAVDRAGTILVSTVACGRGAVVRVDPRSGSQTRLTLGERVPMGIAIEPRGDSALFGDEVGNPVWGYLWRMDLATGGRQLVHTFRGDAVATSIAIHPATRDVFFAARAIYRMTETGPRHIDFDDVTNVLAMTITPRGEMYIVDYMGGRVSHVKPGTTAPLETFGNLPSSVWSMTADNSSLFVATGQGEGGRVVKFDLAKLDTPAATVWGGAPGGVGVYVTVVGELKP